jgi:hypothetical protein
MSALTHPLDDVSDYLDGTLFATREQKDAINLACAASHGIDAFNTFCRLLITSRTKRCGKTTAMDVSSYLCNNAWWTDPTPFALRSKFNEPERPSPFIDEISLIFGENGMRGYGRPEYKLMIESYRRSATLSLSIDRTAVKVKSYCFVVCAGIGAAVPEALRDRSIIIEMRAKPASIKLEDTLDAGVEARGLAYGEKLHAWVRQQMEPERRGEEGKLTKLARNLERFHPKLDSRLAQIWGPLFAIAEAAGGEWPARCLRAFIVLALDVSDKPVLSPEEQILLDALACLREFESTPDVLTSREMLAFARTLDNKVYSAQTDRQMALIMSKGIGSTSVVNPDGVNKKGWHSAEIITKGEELEKILMPDIMVSAPDELDDFFS